MRKTIALIALIIVAAGWLLPEGREIPVVGANSTDWNPRSFWYSPWGRSGVHKGIDIFAKEGRPVVAASPGLVVYTGYNDIGGNVVLVLGAKWRFYYYAHLRDTVSHVGQWLETGEVLGRVGSTGNAHGKPPHLHFSIRSLLPLLWQFQADKPQALLTMFYVDPGVYLAGA
jgi:peptidoglycan LD-endopeptidase LytH